MTAVEQAIAASRPPAPASVLSRRPRGRLVILLLLGLVLGAAGYWWYSTDTYHFAAVQPGVLYRDGNQSVRRFGNAVEKAGAKTVVVLVDDNEVASRDKPQFAQELEYLKQK